MIINAIFCIQSVQWVCMCVCAPTCLCLCLCEWSMSGCLCSAVVYCFDLKLTNVAHLASSDAKAAQL